jgi:phosphoglycerate dehydrogenase-like enzyme
VNSTTAPVPLRVLLVDSKREAQRAWWRGLFPPDLAIGLAPVPEVAGGWRGLLPEADVLVGYRPRLDAADLERAARLRLVVQIGLHPPAFDPGLLATRGVPFVVERDPSNVAVAEHAMLLMLTLARRLVPTARLLAEGRDRHPRAPARTEEESYAFNWAGLEGRNLLYGRTLGLVGLGEIGIEVARRANAFGMRVLYCKRHRLPSELEERLGVEYRALEDLLPEVDVLSLHAPHTAETERLVGAAQLGRMRPPAILVNTARGGLVDQGALVEALRDGRLAGAGLDVYREEPLPYESPLRRLENVVLTPHAAAIRPETTSGAFNGLVGNVGRLVRGEAPAPRAEADLAFFDRNWTTSSR